jgi:serine protease Do
MKSILPVLGAFVIAAGAANAAVKPEGRCRPAASLLSGSGAYLGTSLEDLPAADLKPGAPAGARVLRVMPGSPADKAGLETGDVIVKFDGEAVRGAAHLSRLVKETPPGRDVEVEVTRAGARKALHVTVAEKRNALTEWGRQWGRELAEGLEAVPEIFHDMDVLERRPGRLGIRYQEISGQLARYFQVRDRGVLVTEVVADGPAHGAGMKAGDVLVSVGGRDIADGDDLRRALRDAEESSELAVKVMREGRPLDLKVVLRRKSPSST